MTAYRCYLCGEDGKISRAEVIECLTDAAALAEAERRLAASGYSTIEVWDRARLVGTVGHVSTAESRQVRGVCAVVGKHGGRRSGESKRKAVFFQASVFFERLKHHR